MRYLAQIRCTVEVDEEDICKVNKHARKAKLCLHRGAMGIPDGIEVQPAPFGVISFVELKGIRLLDYVGE